MSASITLDPAVWLYRHGDDLYRYAMARVRDPVVAEDLVQETLLSAWRSARSFRGASPEKTWLIGIMRHKVMDHLRAVCRERQAHQDWSDLGHGVDHQEFDDKGRWLKPFGEWTDVEQSLANEEFWRVFDSCLKGLPERLRTAFILKEIDGIESEALVEAIGISSRNNLWVMLSRARKQMQRCLRTRWFEGGNVSC